MSNPKISDIESIIRDLSDAAPKGSAPSARRAIADVLARHDRRAGQASAAVVDIDPDRLRELALLMTESLGARIGGDGYSPIPGTDPSPSKRRIPPLDRDMTVSQAFTHIAAACVVHMLVNEAAVFSGRDPEGVHQMRVAVRRLRALVPVFGAALEESAQDYLRSELGWVRHELGAARDWDVFLSETIDPMIGRIPSDQGLRSLRTAAVAARQSAYDNAHDALTSKRYTYLTLTLYRWIHDGGWFLGGGSSAERALSRPVRKMATRVLSRRAKKTLKLGKNIRSLDEPDLHQLRISAKKLRYASEFCRSLFRRKQADRYKIVLVELQDLLGTINDVAIGSRLVVELQDKTGPDLNQAEFGRVKGLIDGWLGARAEAAMAGLAPCWTRFAKTKPFWT